MPTTVKVSYTDPETGRQKTETFEVFDDQIYHLLEFMKELDEQTKGY